MLNYGGLLLGRVPFLRSRKSRLVWGMGRASSETRKSRRRSRTYSIIARTSDQRPSALIVISAMFWRARSVAQPARALCGRILCGRFEPGGSTQVNTNWSHLEYVPLRSACRARTGNRTEEPGASCSPDVCRYQQRIVPAEMFTRPLLNLT